MKTKLISNQQTPPQTNKKEAKNKPQTNNKELSERLDWLSGGRLQGKYWLSLSAPVGVWLCAYI